MLQAYPFLAALITAIAVENTVFSRALGLTKPALNMKTVRSCIEYGSVFTWMLALSSMGAWTINWLLYDRPYARYARAIGFLLIVGLVYVGSQFLFEHYLPPHLVQLRRALPLTTFNSALFGALYLNINRDFMPSLGYALGTGLGYTLALLIILYIRKSLIARPVPRAFRGLPAMLIYIGLLSLGIYGLIGHGLPA